MAISVRLAKARKVTVYWAHISGRYYKISRLSVITENQLFNQVNTKYMKSTIDTVAMEFTSLLNV